MNIVDKDKYNLYVSLSDRIKARLFLADPRTDYYRYWLHHIIHLNVLIGKSIWKV